MIEVTLKKEANKIRQKMRTEWKTSLNSRKQIFWKQINCAKDADQFENWLNEDIPIIPRKFRIPEIRGEPESQTDVRAGVAIERVKGEIQLLRLRSSNNQEKVINIDQRINTKLVDLASGRVLEILQEMWKSDCEKEEKKSLERWRYKEIWQLDYVRKYGKTVIKEKINKRPIRNNAPKANHEATARRNISSHTDENKNSNHSRENTRTRNIQQKQSGYTSYQRRSRNSNIQRRTATGPQRKTQNNVSTNKQYTNNRDLETNVFNHNGTTYIGRGTRQYFLGGGKLNGRQRFENSNQNRWTRR
jgi:hypothetical protein